MLRTRPIAALVAPLAVLALAAQAQARTIQIVSADRLELRKLGDQDLVVITGSPVELHIDNDVIKADRVEFNRTKRVLTLVGPGSYLSHPTNPDGSSSEQLLTGQNLVVDLSTQDLSGQDVIVSSANLEIRGEAVQRVPGQLTVQDGYFTPCAKCGRTPNDYAFRAKDIRLYPGDRLVAFGATLLLADAPVAYIPAIVLFLREKDRQPQLSFGQSATDGFTVQASLPFVIGAAAFGNTLVHYYGSRQEHFGLGVNLTAYDPFPSLDRLSLYALAEPRQINDYVPFGYDLDLKLDAKGNVPVDGSVNGLNYAVTATRADTSTLGTGKGVTVVDATAGLDLNSFSVSGEYLDRYGPPPEGALFVPLKKPEVVIDPDPFVLGGLSADFKITAGNYTGQVNPANRTASADAVNNNYTTSRLQEQHTINYTATPWTGSTFSVQNTFTGNYYGNGSRVVNLSIGGGLTQSFGVGNSVGLNYTYTRQEGTSPFANLDQTFARPNITAVLTGSLNLTPITGVGLSASFPYDFSKNWKTQQPATFGVNVSRDPFFLSLRYNPNFFTGLADSGSGQLGIGQSGAGLYFSATDSYLATQGFAPLQLGLSYTDVFRTNNITVGSAFNFQYGRWDNFSLSMNAVASRDPILNPVGFSLKQTLYYGLPYQSQLYPGRSAYLVGSTDLTWRRLDLGETHTLYLERPSGYDPALNNEPLGSVFFKLSNIQGGLYSGGVLGGSSGVSLGNSYLGGAPASSVNWSVTYGGAYSSVRGGWTNPTLVGRFQSTRTLQTFGADATVNMAGLQQPITELTGANLSSSYQFSPRLALGGALHYSLTRSIPGGGVPTTTLNFDSLNLTFGLGSNERPDLYVSTTLRQTFTWVGGVASVPQAIKPIVNLTLDRCCYAFTFTFNPVDQYVRFGLQFPGGSVTPGVTVNGNGPNLDGLNGLF